MKILPCEQILARSIKLLVISVMILFVPSSLLAGGGDDTTTESTLSNGNQTLTQPTAESSPPLNTESDSGQTKEAIPEHTSVNKPSILSPWFFSTIFFLLLTLLLIGLIIWMHRRDFSIKKIFNEEGQVLGGSYSAIVPTNWESQQRKQITTSQNQIEQFAQVIQAFQVLGQDTKDLKTSFDAMKATYMLLQKKLDEKDQEIKNLREGYDLRIYKRFLRQFVKINQAINSYIRDRQFGEQEFENIEYLLADALEEAGVERFSPAVGDDYGAADGVADDPKPVETKNPNLNRTIKEVLDEGYRLETDKEVIQKAKVSVYIFQNSGGE